MNPSFLLVSLSLLFGPLAVFAQRPDTEPVDTMESDDGWGEDWTLDSLNAESFTFESGLGYHVSNGWFPTPFSEVSLSLSIGAGDVFDRAANVRTRAFQPTTEPFDSHDPYRGNSLYDFLGVGNKERQILKPNSDEAVNEGYPTSGVRENIALRFLYHLPAPVILRAEIGHRYSGGMLFSEDTSRSYLGLEGVPHSFREIGVVFHERFSIFGSIGLRIPIYGVFLEGDFGSIGSYYYLFGALSKDVAVKTRTTQYLQIADAKDQIRYANGQDTATLMFRRRPEGFNTTRSGIEAGVGLGLSLGRFVLGYELFISSPLTSLVDDADWKEYYAGARFNIGFRWGTGLQSK